jgi:hypothetical protein
MLSSERVSSSPKTRFFKAPKFNHRPAEKAKLIAACSIECEALSKGCCFGMLWVQNAVIIDA